MAWSPLDKGRLGSLPPAPGGTAEDDARRSLRGVLDAIAADHDVSRPVMALAWLLRHPARMIPVIGTTRPERIRELAQAESVQLERDPWYRLLEAARGSRLP
jgi:hypothetical protein